MAKSICQILEKAEDAEYRNGEEERVASTEEYIERFIFNDYIEIQVAKHKIIQTDSLESFLKENGKKFEIHWIFEIDHLKKARKYVKSLLVNKYSEN